jgi:hypothetical protein
MRVTGDMQAGCELVLAAALYVGAVFERACPCEV